MTRRRVLPGSGAKDGPRRPSKNNNSVPMVSGRPDKAKKPKKSGPRDANGHGDNHHLNYGAYGGYEGVPFHRASRLAGTEIRNELRGLRPDIGSAERLYERSLGDISHIYDQTRGYIGSQNALINQQTVDSRAQSAALAQQLSAQLSQNGTQAQAGSNAELARLGISGAAMPGYFAADQANAQNVASLMGSNADSNLAMMGAGASQIGNLLLGANEGSRGAAFGRAQATRDETIAQVQDAMRQIKGSRRDLTLQLLEQLSQTGWAQYMDQTQLNMQRRAMRGGGGSGSAGYGSSSGSSGSGSSSGAGSSGGSNNYYGQMVEQQIAAATGGGKKRPGKKPKPITVKGDDHRAPHAAPSNLLSGFNF